MKIVQRVKQSHEKINPLTMCKCEVNLDITESKLLAPLAPTLFQLNSSYLPHIRPFARLLLPGRFDPPAFIFFAENPCKSPLEAASPLFANLFLPPNPNFWSLF